MEKLVAYLLANRHRIPNRYFVACLALANLKPTPRQRIGVERLMEVLQASHHTYVSRILRELRSFNLVDFEAGTAGDPGYLFWRVGPPEGWP